MLYPKNWICLIRLAHLLVAIRDFTSLEFITDKMLEISPSYKYAHRLKKLIENPDEKVEDIS